MDLNFNGVILHYSFFLYSTCKYFLYHWFYLCKLVLVTVTKTGILYDGASLTFLICKSICFYLYTQKHWVRLFTVQWLNSNAVFLKPHCYMIQIRRMLFISTTWTLQMFTSHRLGGDDTVTSHCLFCIWESKPSDYSKLTLALLYKKHDYRIIQETNWCCNPVFSCLFCIQQQSIVNGTQRSSLGADTYTHPASRWDAALYKQQGAWSSQSTNWPVYSSSTSGITSVPSLCWLNAIFSSLPLCLSTKVHWRWQ